MIELCDYLVSEHDSDRNDISFSGDEIIIGDILKLGINEVKEDGGLLYIKNVYLSCILLCHHILSLILYYVIFQHSTV